MPLSDTEQIVSVVYPFRGPEQHHPAALFHCVRSELRFFDGAGAGNGGAHHRDCGGRYFNCAFHRLPGGPTESPSRSRRSPKERPASVTGDFSTRIPISSKSEVGHAGLILLTRWRPTWKKVPRRKSNMKKWPKSWNWPPRFRRELLPTQLPQIENLDIAASLTAATEVGGDCYDFIVKEKDGNLLFLHCRRDRSRGGSWLSFRD